MLASTVANEADWMPDANLRAAVREDLGLAADAELTQAKMSDLINLHETKAGITNITGIEHATNLQTFVLWGNSFSDLSPLTNLTALTEIRIGDCRNISDVTPLRNLTNLTKLGLQGNNISDVSALRGLVNLTWLRLVRNPVTDFSPLSGLKANIADVDVNIPDPPPEDTTRPTVSISVPSGTQNGAFDATITFSEAVSDFMQGDVSLSGTANASITAWSANTENTIYTATITPTTSGTVTLNVAADVATDAVSNSNTVARSQTARVDMDKPAVTLTVPAAVQNGAFDVTITFNESVSGFAQSELSLSGTATASITAWDTTDNTLFTATITPTTSGTVTLDIAADVATDAASNGNTAALTQTVTVDVDVPTVVISVPSGTQNGAFNATITFAEVVSGFVQSELLLSGTASASITDWDTTDNTVFTATITPTTSGTVTLDVSADVATDAANNPNTAAAQQTVTVSLPPAIPDPATWMPDANLRTEVRADLGLVSSDVLTQASMLNLTSLHAARSDISNLTGLEFATNLATLVAWGNSISNLSPLTNLTSLTEIRIGDCRNISDVTPLRNLTNLTKLGLQGNNISDVSALRGLVNLTWLRLVRNPVTDFSPLSGLKANITDVDITVPDPDTTRPTVSITVPSTPQNEAFDAVITFSEAVSNFVQTDVTLSGTATAIIMTWTANTANTVYTATITPTTSGTVVLNVAADVATDAADNNNTAATAQTVTIDVDAPTVSITVPSDAQNAAFDVTITFGEAVSDFVQADLTITGSASATAWNANANNQVYTATINPTGTGDITFNVAAGVATDAAGNGNTAATAKTVSVDVDAPTVALAVPSDTQTGDFDVTITFNEAVSNFLQTDVSLTGTATASITVWSANTDRTVYTATITPTTNGTVTVGVAADVATDAAGNNNTAATAKSVTVELPVVAQQQGANTPPKTVTVDVTAPTVTITAPTGAQNGGFDVTVTFNEAVSGFVQSELVVTGNASITTWSTNTANTVFTATITPTNSGTLTFNVVANVATDASNNQNTAATAKTVSVDMDPPSVLRIDAPYTQYPYLTQYPSRSRFSVQNGAFYVSIHVSEEVRFVPDKTLLTGDANATIGQWRLITLNSAQYPKVYTAQVTPTTSGTVTIWIEAGCVTDTAGNLNTGPTIAKSVSVDLDPPSVSIVTPDGVQSGAFDVTIIFSEEDRITGLNDEITFQENDISFTGSTADPSIVLFSLKRDSHSTRNYIYNVRIKPSTSGNVVINVPAGVVTDVGTNRNTAATPKTVTVDIDKPTVTIGVPSGTQTGAFEATVTFNEAVSGFAPSDVSLNGSTASITGWSSNSENTVYTATITPIASGTVTIDVNADVATDAAGNTNTAATPQTVTTAITNLPVTTAPTASISVPSDVQNGAFDVTVTFSESVSDFVQSELVLTGSASITSWSANTENTVFTATITPTVSGEITFNVNANVATNDARNNTAAAIQIVTVDMDAPSVTLTLLLTEVNRSGVQITFTEPVDGFEHTDLSVTTNGLTAKDPSVLSNGQVINYPIVSISGWNPSQDGKTYTAYIKVNTKTEGQVIVNVPAGIATDTAGNINVAGGALNFNVNPQDAPILIHVLTGPGAGTLAVTYDGRCHTTHPAWNKFDVNEDGSIDEADVELVTNALGQFGHGIVHGRTDVNCDDVVDNFDLLLLTDVNGDGVVDRIDTTLVDPGYVIMSGFPEMFPDKNLYLAILYTVDDVRGIVTDLPKTEWDKLSIPLRDIAALSSLDVPNRGISDLTGIDYAYQLSVLNLSNNSISDISPLAGLRNLTTLSLTGNPILDTSPLYPLLVANGGNLATIDISVSEYPPWDVNEDGNVDVTDSTLVTAALGQTGESIVNPRTDVNSDGTIDNADLTLVTENLDSDSGAPSNNAGFVLLDRATLQTLDREVLQTQLAILRAESDGSLKYLRAIALLESVLAAMRPEKTSLLANYPNPFNPETWIPYHLANASDVSITIYDVRGTVVRRLDLGHQQEGYYANRSRAAYWDGRNDIGEHVASGIYFYQLQTDNLSLLRKMVILK